MASRDFVKPDGIPGTHVYEGELVAGMTPASTLDALKTWQLRHDDVFVITYPKSGTHWLFEIVSLIINGGDPDKIERSHMTIAPELIMAPPGDEEAMKTTPPGYKLINNWESPRVMATHLIEKFLPPDVWRKNVKVLYLGRNPKDVFCSAASFHLSLMPKELQDFDNFIKYNLLCEQVPFGTWFQHVKGYEKHHGKDNFLFVRYENLQKDHLYQVKRIAQFLDRPLSEELADKITSLTTIKEMKNTYDKHEETDPEGIMHTRAFGTLKFLNKGKVGTWKGKITGDLNDLFDKVYQEKMASSNLQFDFEI
ncbi:sulfotransferase 1E1-like [Amphiura filiformis]|uniref:sulfotransferase 1E1-like n=1 Tax=Amphiura filiformis TaxID=82378 RepID=UPI003B21284E